MPEKIVAMFLAGLPEPRPRNCSRLFQALFVIPESVGFPIIEISPFIGEFQAGEFVGAMLYFFRKVINIEENGLEIHAALLTVRGS